ncbi:MAG: CHAD domain-containing protein [Betaproteobacteria bacterium]|nr:MAG: CHAD domain-containing protein [Betaproteobacteria bacterium]
MLRLTKILHGQDWVGSRNMKKQEIAVLAPKAFAASILDEAHREVLRHGKRLNRSSLTGFHKLRINIKKLLYASELLSPLFGNKSARNYLAHLADLKRVLGQLNDATTSEKLIERLAPGNDDPA